MEKNTCKIDIHAHILPIDHGSKDDFETEEMLKEASSYNVKKIVCTSHYYSEHYDINFIRIKKLAKKYNIQLYKGHEVMIYDIEDIINKKVNLIGKTNYVLIELKRNNQIPIKEIKINFINLIEKGYKIILAHPELSGLSLSEIKELNKIGIVFQIDAYSFYLKQKELILKLLKNNLIDVVSSDIHYNNKGYLYLDKFYNYISNKYSEKLANKLFYDNPRKIIYNKKIK